MKIAILGTGAIGSLFAAGLAEKHDLICVVRSQSHADTINNNGIVISEKDGTTRTARVKAVTDTRDLKPFDLVLIAVKAPSTEEAVQTHCALFGKDTVAVTLQNGYGNHADIEAVANPDRIIIGTTAQGANMSSDGRVNHAGSGVTTIGALHPQAPDAKNLLDSVSVLFREAGFETVITSDAEDAVIRKLFVNIGINAVCALNDCANRFISENPEMRRYSRQLIDEAVAVFEAAGRSYDGEKIWEHVESVAKATGDNFCSMVQDLRKGRPTEIKKINGIVVQLADERNIAAPFNREITQKIENISLKKSRS